MRLADLIREGRERLGWSQADLAQESGLSPAAISRIERGEVQGRAQSIAILTNALGLSAETVRAVLSEEAESGEIQYSDLSKVPPEDRPKVREAILAVIRAFEEKDR